MQRALCSAGARLWAGDVKRLILLAEIVQRRYERELREMLPSVLVDALVQGEDHRFYDHIGVDFVGILSALYRYFRFGGTLGGASTIHQQLVRVLTQYRRKTVRRKVREIVLACCLDRNYSKSDIAGMYLTVAYFGWQMNGVAEASKRLSIALPRMSKRQAAALIARLKYPEPSQLSDERSRLIVSRTQHILQLMSFAHDGIVQEMICDETVPNI
jgi:membrane peptidoglycan carboxypeptidase